MCRLCYVGLRMDNGPSPAHPIYRLSLAFLLNLILFSTRVANFAHRVSLRRRCWSIITYICIIHIYFSYLFTIITLYLSMIILLFITYIYYVFLYNVFTIINYYIFLHNVFPFYLFTIIIYHLFLEKS